MAKQHPKKQLAQILYVQLGLSAKEVAEQTGISENTISRWVNADAWGALKQSFNLSPDRLIKLYYEQSEKIVNAAKDESRSLSASDCDALNKLAAAIQKLDKKIDPSVTMSVLAGLQNYIKTFDLELAKSVTRHSLEYVQTLINAKK